MNTVFDLARVTIELTSPFLIGTGDGDAFVDAVFVTDANGLPALPGTSLAGVLRASVGADFDTEAIDQAFGFQHRNDGAASLVRTSWGHVHASDDAPVPFRGAQTADPVLAFLAAGVVRDRVRIGPHGAVDGRGKFDELLVPAGARFSFELVVDACSTIPIAHLLDALARPEVALGRSTRNGLGAFRVVRYASRRFNLAERADFDAFAALPVDLSAPVPDVVGLQMHDDAPEGVGGGWLRGRIELTPVSVGGDPAGTWAVGGALPGGPEPPALEGDRVVDRFPMTERRVDWSGGRGVVTSLEDAEWLLPGSSVKGALRHRTAFHARRIAGTWGLSSGASELPEVAPVEELFGSIRDSDDPHDARRGQRGRVIIHDVRLNADDGVQMTNLLHVALDRFTQGPIDGKLFSESVLFGGSLSIPIDVDVRDELSVEARQALSAALDDLCSARATLGAARGHGRFEGRVVWDGNGSLLQAQEDNHVAG